MGSNVFRYSARRYIFGLPFVLVDGKWKFDWHGNVKFGYIFKRLFLAFILYWVAWFLVMNNLWSNSVYYAKNMPHKEGTDPVLVLLVENLEWMNTVPPEGFKYDFDGHNTILSNGPGDEVYFGVDSDGYIYSNAYEISYSFDESFGFVSGLDWKKFNKGESYKINKNDVDIDELKKEIYEFVDPLVKLYDVEPWINLQWIFNWYYHDRFN